MLLVTTVEGRWRDWCFEIGEIVGCISFFCWDASLPVIVTCKELWLIKAGSLHQLDR